MSQIVMWWTEHSYEIKKNLHLFVILLIIYRLHCQEKQNGEAYGFTKPKMCILPCADFPEKNVFHKKCQNPEKEVREVKHTFWPCEGWRFTLEKLLLLIINNLQGLWMWRMFFTFRVWGEIEKSVSTNQQRRRKSFNCSTSSKRYKKTGQEIHKDVRLPT